MSSSESVVSSTKDFVIKLRLVGSDGHPEIRRVRLSRISNKQGEVSYAELLKVVVALAFPDSTQLENYQVLMTYYDIDNDCVTITSTEELIDAIEQFYVSDPKVLRVTTDIKLKQPIADLPSRGSSSQDCPNTNVNANGRAIIHLQNVLESFLSVVTVAVDTVQKQVVQVNVPSDNAPATSTQTGTEPSDHESSDNISTNETSHNNTDADAAAAATVQSDGIENQVNETNMKPFIHGRHTCDTCLCTPIVGKRWHATNRQDYDLCHNCHGNYTGTEIHFEIAELDRDRPFQMRWQHKRELSERRAPCRPHGHGHGHRRGPCARSHHGRRRYGNQFRWNHERQPEPVDVAMKEAIRRSLEDVQPEDNLKPEPSAPVDGAVVSQSRDGEILSPASVSEDNSPSTSTAENGETMSPDSAFDDNSDVDKPSESTENNEQAEQHYCTLEQLCTAPQQGDTSFASDAIGSGETAETLGHTLDSVAQAIDDMVSELADTMDEVHQSQESEHKQENVGDDEKIADGIRSVGNKSEASEDEWQVVSDSDENIVEESTDDDQLISDEMLARATQLIGSALFESDIRSNEPDPDHGAESSATFSIASSLPTLSSNAEISTSVLERWDVQLTQLHELGFFDDSKTVDILERLYAANIGVDCDDEISVTKVVNELLTT